MEKLDKVMAVFWGLFFIAGVCLHIRGLHSFLGRTVLDLNSGPHVCQAGALPLELHPIFALAIFFINF
jgi:hypothetical protein